MSIPAKEAETMARTGKLTAVEVTKAKGPAVLHDGGGLYLRIAAPREVRGVEVPGAKSWVFRFQLDGKRRDMGLGPFPDISLAEARAKATEHRKQRHEGIDPLDAKAAQRQAQRVSDANSRTFRECAVEFIEKNRVGWRNAKHAAQWGSTLETYVYPVIGDLAVQGVDVGLVLQAIEPIWTAKPETASRVRGRIESILDWATARGYREGENPARWRGHLEYLLPARSKVSRVEHLAALPYAEIGTFMTELRQQQGVAARALEFAILTAARTGEVLGARWDEINIADRVWTVPAERMKTGKEHRVPLSDAATVIIEEMAEVRRGDHVFPGTARALAHSRLRDLLLRVGRADLTVHGFRSTFRDWAAERTAFPAEVAEMALGHTVGDKVEAAYRRGDLLQKRRQLMDAWAKHCATVQAAGGNVVTMQKVAGQ